MHTTALDQYTTHRANCERENSELRERERERWGGGGEIAYRREGTKLCSGLGGRGVEEGGRGNVVERAKNCVVYTR